MKNLMLREANQTFYLYEMHIFQAYMQQQAIHE